MEEALTKMVIDSNANSSGTNSHLSALVMRLVLKAVARVLRTPAALKTIPNAALYDPGLFAPVAAFVESEHNCLSTEQAKLNA